MPKIKVKRCVRPQCMAIFPLKGQNKYCDCGAMLGFAEITMKASSDNKKDSKDNTNSKQKKGNDKPKKNHSEVDIKENMKEVSEIEETAIISNFDNIEDEEIEKVNSLEEVEKLEEFNMDSEVGDGDNCEGSEQKAEDEDREESIQQGVDSDAEEIDYFELEDEEDVTSTEAEECFEQPLEKEVDEEVIEKKFEFDFFDIKETKAFLYLLLDDDDIEFELSNVTRIGRASDGIQVDIDLSEYAGKDVSREHAVITKEKDGYFITNTSKNHSVRIVKQDGSENALEYGKKVLLISEDGILLSKKILLQFVEEE